MTTRSFLLLTTLLLGTPIAANADEATQTQTAPAAMQPTTPAATPVAPAGTTLVEPARQQQQPRMAVQGKTPVEAAEDLKAELQLTPAQLPAWQKVTDLIEAPVARPSMVDFKSASLADMVASRAAFEQNAAAHDQALAQALKTFEASLTDQQKQKLKTAFFHSMHPHPHPIMRDMKKRGDTPAPSQN